MITFFSHDGYVPPAPTQETFQPSGNKILHDRAKFILLVQKDGIIFYNTSMSQHEPVLQCGNMVISEGFSIELARYLKKENIEILRFNKYEPLDKEVVEFLVDNDMLFGNHITLTKAIMNSHATKEYRVFATMKYK